MIVGFDVYHGGAGSRGGSIGAMVATIDPAFTQYYSTASIFNSREELSTKMYQDMESMFYLWFYYNLLFHDSCDVTV